MVLTDVKTAEEFDKCINSDAILIVTHFWAEWAPQCRQMDDVMEELSNDNQYKDVKFIKIEAEALADIAEKFNVNCVPTMVFFNKKKMIDRLDGANVPELIKKVKQLLSKALIIPSPQSKEDLNEQLKKLVNAAPCMLFMKGSPEEPRCGFSRQTIELLKKYNAEFKSFDILSDEEVRQGLKTFSNWPTYPQLYINGELIGGLDILKELAENGELENLLPKKQSLNQRLEALIKKAPVMIFMKGNPDVPRCGFSKTLIGIMNETGVSYETFDILQDEEVRQGLKTYSNWPTYPQVYVNGTLIGGLDIIKELNESNELKQTLLGNKN
ncbi:glutaredoxin-3 [Centruroides vittatus]|uniref:glutaredoxin-3 n=1 Tax=Centruroides vittatus TaxID=120091 RepID=UPI00350EF94C